MALSLDEKTQVLNTTIRGTSAPTAIISKYAGTTATNPVVFAGISEKLKGTAKASKISLVSQGYAAL